MILILNFYTSVLTFVTGEFLTESNDYIQFKQAIVDGTVSPSQQKSELRTKTITLLQEIALLLEIRINIHEVEASK